MGAVGGGAVNLVKGFYNSPKGYGFAGGLHAIRREAPKIGGSFAVWGGLFSAFDCTLVAIRRKEDPWNPIMSGALTGGVLSCATASPPPADPPRLADFSWLSSRASPSCSLATARSPAAGDDRRPPAAPAGASAGPQPTPTVVSADGMVSEGVAAPEETKQKSGGSGGTSSAAGGRRRRTPRPPPSPRSAASSSEQRPRATARTVAPRAYP